MRRITNDIVVYSVRYSLIAIPKRGENKNFQKKKKTFDIIVSQLFARTIDQLISSVVWRNFDVTLVVHVKNF